MNLKIPDSFVGFEVKTFIKVTAILQVNYDLNKNFPVL